MQTIIIDGPPTAKGRPKFANRGKFVTVYTPKKTLEAEAKVRHNAICQDAIKIPKGVPIKLQMIFHMPIPASYSKKKREALVGTPHVKKPDADNIEKLVCDALNGVCWEDDSQICNVQAIKVYAMRPRTVIKYCEV